MKPFAGFIRALWPFDGEPLQGPVADMIGSAHSNKAKNSD